MSDALRSTNGNSKISRPGWQVCRISMYVFGDGDSSKNRDKWVMCWLHRYTPFGITGKDLIGIDRSESDRARNFRRTEQLRAEAAIPRLHDQIAVLGTEGWELTRVDRRNIDEFSYSDTYWFRRSIED